ncbi:hypothetical protein FB559_6316 [Actinoallomurus bryophytorum]|uniref:Uncharacterized protein n=1 Tax=Actinoallomurus bryophytorum TaxID=1490222 RepID=A0A543CU74_9ACTN|nr:hypothetical protein [Actinoallomurus bryophytorum]TQM00601.1 hypothetical protein FB559_6316 [Actinoallomurus bryophytorum]
MLKKTIASVGLAAAATAGALFVGGSPASAQTTQASARSDVAYVQTIATSTGRHHADHYRSWYYRHHHHHGWRHYDHADHHVRIVIHDSDHNVAVSH